MSYGQFEAKLLVACHLLAEKSGNEINRVRDILAEYELEAKPNWIMRALGSYSDLGLAKDLRTHEEDIDQDVWLTAAGVKQAEEWLDSGAVRFEREDDAAPFDPKIFDPANFDTGEQVPAGNTLDSSDWTGIEERLLTSPEVIDDIRNKIREIDMLIDKSGLTNTERQKAKAISEALVKLVDSPQPEWRAIVELLTSKPLTAIVNLTALLQIALGLIVGG